jgi:hypothetical protein
MRKTSYFALTHSVASHGVSAQDVARSLPHHEQREIHLRKITIYTRAHRGETAYAVLTFSSVVSFITKIPVSMIQDFVDCGAYRTTDVRPGSTQ